MATHSSILAWRIPWREEPGRLQSVIPWDHKELDMTDWPTHTQKTFRRLRPETGKMITVKSNLFYLLDNQKNLEIYFNLILRTGRDKRQWWERIMNNEEEEKEEEERESGIEHGYHLTLKRSWRQMIQNHHPHFRPCFVQRSATRNNGPGIYSCVFYLYIQGTLLLHYSAFWDIEIHTKI